MVGFLGKKKKRERTSWRNQPLFSSSLHPIPSHKPFPPPACPPHPARGPWPQLRCKAGWVEEPDPRCLTPVSQLASPVDPGFLGAMPLVHGCPGSLAPWGLAQAFSLLPSGSGRGFPWLDILCGIPDSQATSHLPLGSLPGFPSYMLTALFQISLDI